METANFKAMEEISRKEELIKASDSAKSHLQEELSANAESLELEKQTTQALRDQLDTASKQFEHLQEQLEENRNQVSHLGQQVEDEKKLKTSFAEELESANSEIKQLQDLVKIHQHRGKSRLQTSKT